MTLEPTVAVEDAEPPISPIEARRLLKGLARRLNVPHQTLGVLFTGDEALRAMNRKFRGIDRATDVLSFPSGEQIHLGDIAVSSEMVRRQCRRRGHGPSHEAKILLIHGFLHLLGYDHEVDDGEMDLIERTLRWELTQTKAPGW